VADDKFKVAPEAKLKLLKVCGPKAVPVWVKIIELAERLQGLLIFHTGCEDLPDVSSLLEVILPLTVKVLILIVNVFFRLAAVLVTVGTPILSDPQSKVPEPLIDAFVEVVAEFKRATAPETVKVAPLATIKPEVEADALLNVIEATAFVGVVFTLTTSPALIIMISPAAGTPAGVHVVAVFQLVLPVLVLVVCAKPIDTNKKNNTVNTKVLKSKYCNFLSIVKLIIIEIF
jgi:hypothetical protein